MFGNQVNADAMAHALAEYPNESCGLVINNAYMPCDNIAEDKRGHFRINAKLYPTDGTLQAVIHSHTNGIAAPSAADMRGQIASAIPWGIVNCDGVNAEKTFFWGDFILDEPILGQKFRHGVNDCYTPIRKWYWQNRQIKLIDMPRDVNWWDAGENLYAENFSKGGFVRIEAHEVKPGDVFLMQFRSDRVNHAALIVDSGLAIHHFADSISQKRPIGPYLNNITHWLRHDDSSTSRQS